MLDRATFLRPIAHRGLHDAARGIVENSSAAFAAAMAKGHGIECDLQPAADGTPMVFHDQALQRLVDAPGLLRDHRAEALCALTYRGTAIGLSTFDQMLAQVGGRVPLLVEVKSDWRPPDPAFMRAIAEQASRYQGPIALMSFDPAVMVALRALAPTLPRGIVSGVYQSEGWWSDVIDRERAFRLTHLIESGPVGADFFAYHVQDLPTPVTRFVREGLGIPLFTWTVRTPQDRARASAWADAPIFECFEPD